MGRCLRDDVDVEFRVLNTWYDPQAERAAIQSLAEAGVGAIYVVAIAPVPAIEAGERANVFVLSHFGDQSQFAPTQWLTGTERLWQRLYQEITQRVLDSAWEATTFSGGLKEGYVRLASFGPRVPAEAITRVRELTQARVAGELELFPGPLRDSRGELRVPSGENASWSELVDQRWMVEGIVTPTAR